ncbi:acetyl-CoA carboxylase biotin carboxyl carrier protein [Halobacillus karajensis]|uniref:Biotin carboxyl carrier protein of acetyl-CoA carboxylase n=1 Tax=Halobacillus karajensis TaxID=195088 RepID=A0A024P5I5_9BACI|nr:acetyl-CoA carboxylase biotin carboxyl carrier protein [Halobacillus karajensis]CDQ17898.1 Biotin carboxyl carrier protein of acetyl-CoA carboxylase [Halobacillus karajensis]CDQ24304.1 Biotin carboxyl carrier protein of acetyl-CoA carboxylase [Halobacillus karajensis]CDQ29447.1 Biotin carboxyl carrier protein of acetyl-CoA carboxylase [Halobacillus karajensis]SEH62042.1 acetyl-CoA carboxylase biotin carboxyl carrier protein [Halobacillus karajensis]
MLKVQEIREIIKLIDQSNIDEFSYETNGTKVQMKKQQGEVMTTPSVVQQPAVQAQPEPAPKQEVVKEAPKKEVKEEPVKEEAPKTQGGTDFDAEVKSPMVGTFYQSPSPDQEAYVKVGDQVKEDSVVCIVEAMKLFNEIEAEVSGEIVEILVKDGELVEYGQPLFRVKSK